MPARNDEHVAEDRGLGREERDDAFVAVHLTGAGIVAVDDLAELAQLTHNKRTFAWATQLSKLLTRFA